MTPNKAEALAALEKLHRRASTNDDNKFRYLNEIDEDHNLVEAFINSDAQTWQPIETAFVSTYEKFEVGPYILILTKYGEVHKARWTQGFRNTLGFVTNDEEGQQTYYPDQLRGWMHLPPAPAADDREE